MTVFPYYQCVRRVAYVFVAILIQPWSSGVIFVDPEHPPCPVIMSTDAHVEEKRVVRDFADYLFRMTGAEFQVEMRQPDQSLPERCIAIGDVWYDAPKALGYFGFTIRSTENRVIIAGHKRWGTANGVYKFLEEDLGCIWWSHDEEYVPAYLSLEVDVNRSATPAFPDGVYLMNQEATLCHYKFGSQNGKSHQFLNTHNLPKLLLPLAKRNPEYRPMNNSGKRAWNGIHANYLASGLAESLAGELEKQVIERGKSTNYYIYNIEMGDSWGEVDMSPESQAMYTAETWIDSDGRENPGWMAPALKMTNKIAEVLEKKYPGIQVGTLAYFRLQGPPRTVRPRHNVHIRYPRHRKCTVLGIRETEVNYGYLRNLERWLEIAPGRVHVWEYGTSFFNYLFPFPCLRALADNIKLYHKLGVANLHICGNYGSTGGDLTILKNYVWRKLMWEPTLDTELLIQQFCRGYYGPAHAEMYEYVDTLEQSVREPTHRYCHEMEDPRLRYLTTDLIVQLREILVRALAKADGRDPKFDRRIREVMACVDAAQYWRTIAMRKPTVFEERDGQLVAKGSIESHYKKVRAIIPYLRGASDGEWGVARSRQLYQLRAHGGPIATLGHGALHLKVAPVQAARIGPLTVSGATVFTETTMYSHKGKLIAAEWTEPPSTRVIKMHGDGGLAMWKGASNHVVYQEVNVINRDSVVMNGYVKLTTNDRQYANRTQATIDTTFNVSADLSDFSLETWSQTSKQWTTIDLNELVTTPLINGNSEYQWPKKTVWGLDGALRIRRPNSTMTDVYRLPNIEPQHFDDTTPKEWELKPITTIEILFNKQDGILMLRVYMGLVDLAMNEAVPVVRRRITVKRH